MGSILGGGGGLVCQQSRKLLNMIRGIIKRKNGTIMKDKTYLLVLKIFCNAIVN
jgi:hypothetical protein